MFWKAFPKRKCILIEIFLTAMDDFLDDFQGDKGGEEKGGKPVSLT